MNPSVSSNSQNVPSGSQSKTRLSTPIEALWVNPVINLPRCADLKLTVSFAFDTFNAKLEVLVTVPDPVTRSRIVTIARVQDQSESVRYIPAYDSELYSRMKMETDIQSLDIKRTEFAAIVWLTLFGQNVKGSPLV
jgi:hypothetical protein